MKKLESIVFWLHFPIVLILFGMFLIPNFIWNKSITFHFWYVITIIITQITWGLIIINKTKRIDIVCPLTTLMQSIRGYKIEDKRNYDHSYIAELLEKLGFKVKYKTINFVIISTVVITTVQYFFFNH